MVPAAETTPLLEHEDPHAALFDELDADHDHDHIHDHPPCPKKRAVKSHLISATCPAGHGHPVHHHLQSPALILRMQQGLEHGFANVSHAVHSFFSNAMKKAKTSEREDRQPIFIVIAVFIVAVLTMLAMTAIGPTLLLYMNRVGFTTSIDISAYVTASALSSGVPVLSNTILGQIASRFGPGRALAVGASVAAFGLLLVILSRTSLAMFFIGYALYASCNSLRVIRVSILSKVVPAKERTTVLATHALMTPIGALMGPLMWIMLQTFRGEIPLLGGWLILDRFSLDYTFAALILLTIAVVSVAMLTRIVPTGSSSSAGASSSGTDMSVVDQVHEVTIHMSNGDDTVVDLEKYRNRVFMYFCGIMLGVNMSAGVFMTAFQPVLVNVFHTSDAKLGLIFELIAIFAIVPPLLVALLSRWLMDRQILLIGLGSKLIGMALFLPLFGAVREWQVIAGFMLIVKASIFFSTASMSLFTKVLGSMSTSSLLGLLSSGSSIGPAVAQILLSKHIVQLFGSMWFGLFALPAIATLGFIVWPGFWRTLDPDREFTRLLTHEAEVQQAASA